MLSMSLFICSSMYSCICCHIPLYWCAFSSCRWYSCWLRCCFLQYRNLIYWLILNLMALIVVFLSCGFCPLILTLMYLGFSCLALHILLNHIAAFVFNSLVDKLKWFYENAQCNNKIYMFTGELVVSVNIYRFCILVSMYK